MAAIAFLFVFVISGLFVCILHRFIGELKNKHGYEWARLGRPRVIDSLLAQLSLYAFILSRRYRRLPGPRIQTLGNAVIIGLCVQILYIGIIATIFGNGPVRCGPFSVWFYSMFR